jgi:hypothetical protein
MMARGSVSNTILAFDGQRPSFDQKTLFDLVAETEFQPEPVERYDNARLCGRNGRVGLQRLTYRSYNDQFIFKPTVSPTGWNDWGMTLHYFMPESLIHCNDQQTYGRSVTECDYAGHSCLSVDVRGNDGNVTVSWHLHLGPAIIPIISGQHLPAVTPRSWNQFWSKIHPEFAFQRYEGDELWKSVMLLRAAIDHGDPELKLRPLLSREALGQYLVRMERENSNKYGD